MYTAALTALRDCWWACVGLLSGVEQFSLSTELDPTLKSPGSLEIFGLSLPESEGPGELPTLQM